MKKIKYKIAALICGIGLLTTITATNVSAKGILYCLALCDGYIICLDFGREIPLQQYFDMQDVIDESCN
jgi:hypothetical protein